MKTLLKFWVIAEVLSKLLVPYPSVSRLGRTLVSGLGAVLALLFGVVAGFGHVDRSIRLISGLEQTVFVIELGLIVLLFLFAAYFHLSWDRLSFGILLGLGVSACVRLATWAVINNATPREFPSEHTLTLFSFLNVATYHLCVLIWLSYVLVPQKVGTKSEVPWSENKLYFAVMLAVVLALVVGTVKLVGWKVPVDDGCSLGGTKGISTEPTVWQGSYGTAVTIRFATGTERLEGAQAVAIEPEEGYFLPVSGLTVPVMKLEPEL